MTNYRTAKAFFVDDTPNGTLCECQECKHIQEITCDLDTKVPKWYCLKCGIGLLYPEGASW